MNLSVCSVAIDTVCESDGYTWVIEEATLVVEAIISNT
jgi:hypothetical protein